MMRTNGNFLVKIVSPFNTGHAHILAVLDFTSNLYLSHY